MNKEEEEQEKEYNKDQSFQNRISEQSNNGQKHSTLSSMNTEVLPILNKIKSDRQLQRRSNNSARLFSQSSIEEENNRKQNDNPKFSLKGIIMQSSPSQSSSSSSSSSCSSRSQSQSKSSSQSSRSSSKSSLSESNEKDIKNNHNIKYNDDKSPSSSSQEKSQKNKDKDSKNMKKKNKDKKLSIDYNISNKSQDVKNSKNQFMHSEKNKDDNMIQGQKSQSLNDVNKKGIKVDKYKVSIDYQFDRINEDREDEEEKEEKRMNEEYMQSSAFRYQKQMNLNLSQVSEQSEITPTSQLSFQNSLIHQTSKKLMTLLPNANEGDQMTLDMLIGDIQNQKQIGIPSIPSGNSLKDIPSSEEITFSNTINNNSNNNHSNNNNIDNKANQQIARNDKQRQAFNDMFYFSDQIKILENITKLDNHLMAQEVRLKIIQAIKRHFAFSNLGEQHIDQVVNKMFACTAQPGEYIFQQNDEASLFFFIEQGNVCIEINKEFKKCLDEYYSFGELALLYNSPRSASVQAGQSGIQLILWAIDRVTFLNAIKHLNQQDLEVNRKFLENVSFFSNFTHEQKDLLASQFTYQKFHKSEIIVSIGDDANSFYIIKQGQISIMNSNNEEERQLQSGDWFGESSLYLNKSIRTRTVQAKSFEVVLLALSRKAAQEILGDTIQYLAFRNLMRWAFEKDKILCKLITMQREKIFSHLHIRKLQLGEQAINSLRPNQICVVLEGALKQQGNNVVYEKAQVVGSMCLITQEFKSDYITVAETDSLIAEISKEQIEYILGGTYEQLVTKNRKSHENSVYFSRGSEKKLFDDEDLLGLKQVRLVDFIYIKELGRGNFGSVNLVYNSNQNELQVNKKINTTLEMNPGLNNRKSKYVQNNPETDMKDQKKENINEKKDKLFAVKVFISNYIFQRGIEKYMLREKSTLQKCNFPFIMRYYRSFYDNYHIYFMNEFINGMDFFTVMREVGLFNKKQAQFYTAFVILTLQYLNNQGIVYRDLKPENILIDHQGWPKLVDMGTAKCLFDQNKQLVRTYSLVGTPHYMAPEVIQQKGYGFSVDIYSLGVILYELLVGYLPYGEDVDDPIEVYQLIIEGKLGFPNHMKTRLSDKKLISQLMAKSPEVRIGGSYGALKSHEWFEDFDWDEFFNKQMTPPYIPPEEKITTDTIIDHKIKHNQKNSFQTIMMIQSAQSGRYEKEFKITNKQTEFLKNFAY